MNIKERTARILENITEEEWTAILKVAQDQLKQKSQETPKQNQKGRGVAVEKTVSKEEMMWKITDLIHQIGIPAHIKGYQYIRSAISYYMTNKNTVYISLTKELYPTIAMEFGSTPTRVERAIRHAIEVAFDRGEKEKLNEIFGDLTQYYRGKPSNGEVIATIAEYLRMH